MKVLVVGGSSVSGQAAFQAIKELDSSNQIITTTSRDEDVAGADFTIKNIELEKAHVVEKILASEFCKDIDYQIYIPARGQVGMSARDAKKIMVEESLDYSFRPFLRLSKALQAKKNICLSGFITMEPLLEVYGAMAFTKIAMEQLVVKHKDIIQVIRIGMFYSNSVRGIALMVQRNLMKDKESNLYLYNNWKASGKKFSDFFYAKNYRVEEENYKKFSNGVPFRPTETEDIKNAFKKALTGEDAAIINCLGAWYWLENTMPYLPAAISDNLDLIPDDLEALLI